MIHILEYIWLDANGNCRSKTKVVDLVNGIKLELCPEWNYDGSSTGQATTENSEIILKPVKLYLDPFRRKENAYLVLCEIFNVDGTPHNSNNRFKANEIFSKGIDLKPMFGLEQEFFISKELDTGDLVPLGFFNKENCREQGDYYCGVGGNNVIGKEIIEDAMDNLLYSNISITGMNAEVAPSQWEFQVCDIGISAADDLILLRYICNRTFEKNNWVMDIRAKPKKGDWNGSGCHVNFSTLEMRSEGGLATIYQAIKNLEKQHELHIKHYGDDNSERLTGEHETSSINDFSFGVGSRNTSIRIPNQTESNEKGYFEDRRPSSSLDPYKVTSLLYSTSIGMVQDYFTN